ncbi:hypothetical protein CXB51_013776 [Gossypium anomalum]|uniref:Glyoxal oxidase N-terminal domain-containing protein n=1 Tax=Gossypium anomalum TaxID=47600 RepID=A0A8J5YZE2_9ROSI|nr:hypothetical protein CXB51_013776 [Gossypium anomalum]
MSGTSASYLISCKTLSETVASIFDYIYRSYRELEDRQRSSPHYQTLFWYILKLLFASLPHHWTLTSVVLLPLKNLKASAVEAKVLVCGGASKGSCLQSLKGNFMAALDTCAQIKITDPNLEWLINGAKLGIAGWEQGRDLVLSLILYRPENDISSRFEIQNATTIPQMYHSTTTLLGDGRVLVGGSNPHTFYNFTGILFPTELSLETFSLAIIRTEEWGETRGNQTRWHYSGVFQKSLALC